ncbi:MAG: DUF1343 domain-containing protein [Acidobacteria bacterium]|nr:DUF1343 domain-containing protein [Acidobacteriota bacterium]
MSCVQTGLDVFLQERLGLARGKRVGVIAHPASVDSQIRHIVELFFEHPEIQLTTIMGPQHGARGETQDNMIEWGGYFDPAIGLPVYSLYSRTRKPTREMLADIDVLFFDLQDVGSRYYTFIYTMALAMQACAEEGREFVVLDRPNPIGGIELEGPILDPEFSSFVGMFPLPVRHGMTPGELARYFNEEFEIGCALHVVCMKGWNRCMYFDQTGLPWVLPSPNMPSIETALVYPGTCLLEGTNISEGRGTTRPFEMSGAPWVRAEEMVTRLKQAKLPGVIFRPAYYIPTFHKWCGEMVGGVQIHVIDRSYFKPFSTGLEMLRQYRLTGGDRFQWKSPPYEYEMVKLPIDILCGTDQIRLQLETGADTVLLEERWRDDLERFAAIRKNYLLY